MAKPLYIPNPEEIPSGLCECGCGKQTQPASHTRPSMRKFKGHPNPRLAGHNGKDGHPYTWKGGRYKTREGYVCVYLPEHPASGERGYVKEHRVVWERANGRRLLIEEHIHHINGIRDDNRLENLQLLTRSDHGKEHGTHNMQRALALCPDMHQRAAKARLTGKRWRGHIKNNPNCPHCEGRFPFSTTSK